jgi:hypothetical protein
MTVTKLERRQAHLEQGHKNTSLARKTVPVLIISAYLADMVVNGLLAPPTHSLEAKITRAGR